MGTYAEGFEHALPTAATLLAGVLRRNCHHSLPGACCLESEDGAELIPRSIADALGEVGVSQQIADLQVFEIDHLVLAEQCECGLMLKGAPLALHLLVFPLQERHRLLPAVAALLPAGDPAVGGGQLLFHLAVVAKGFPGLALPRVAEQLP